MLVHEMQPSRISTPFFSSVCSGFGSSAKLKRKRHLVQALLREGPVRLRGASVVVVDEGHRARGPPADHACRTHHLFSLNPPQAWHQWHIDDHDTVAMILLEKACPSQDMAGHNYAENFERCRGFICRNRAVTWRLAPGVAQPPVLPLRHRLLYAHQLYVMFRRQLPST